MESRVLRLSHTLTLEVTQKVLPPVHPVTTVTVGFSPVLRCWETNDKPVPNWVINGPIGFSILVGCWSTGVAFTAKVGLAKREETLRF